MDFAQARAAMVDTQLRPNNLRDPRLIAQFLHLPRELFVPEEQKALAYIDASLPIQVHQGAPVRHLLAPMTLARLLQSAAPSAGDKVLDVGGVTGYGAALLAAVCKTVIALETDQITVALSENALKSAAISNVQVVHGPLNEGYADGALYDIIVMHGCVNEQPKMLFDQLAENGRLVVIMGGKWCGQATVFTKVGGCVAGQAVFDANGEIVPGFEKQPSFVF